MSWALRISGTILVQAVENVAAPWWNGGVWRCQEHDHILQQPSQPSQHWLWMFSVLTRSPAKKTRDCSNQVAPPELLPLLCV